MKEKLGKERVSLRTYNREYTCSICKVVKPCNMFSRYDHQICIECKNKMTKEQQMNFKIFNDMNYDRERNELISFLDSTLKTYGNCAINKKRYSKNKEIIDEYVKVNFSKDNYSIKAYENCFILSIF